MSAAPKLRSITDHDECPKCGGLYRRTFHAHGPYRSEYGCAAVDLFGTSFPPEHLCLFCQDCGFGRPAAPKDA